MLTTLIRVIDWNTKQQFQILRMGKGDWINWLVVQNYEIIDLVKLAHTAIEVHKAHNINLYAVYCPLFATFDTECLFINIPKEEEARSLITKIKQQLEPLIAIISDRLRS
jgi:hypothetical protein